MSQGPFDGVLASSRDLLFLRHSLNDILVLTRNAGGDSCAIGALPRRVESLMVIDVKRWNRRLRDAIDKAFPGKQLKVDEKTKSLNGMVKDSLSRRGIPADKAILQKEVRETIAVLRASDLGDDLELFMRAFGGRPKAVKRKPSKEGKTEPSKRKNVNPLSPEKIFSRSEEYVDIYIAGQRLPGSYGSNQKSHCATCGTFPQTPRSLTINARGEMANTDPMGLNSPQARGTRQKG